MDFRWLFESSPWWFAALAIAATVAISIAYGNRLPAWTMTVLGAIRAGAATKFKIGKLPKPTAPDPDPMPEAKWAPADPDDPELQRLRESGG